MTLQIGSDKGTPVAVQKSAVNGFCAGLKAIEKVKKVECILKI